MYSKILLKVVQIFLFQLLILMGSVNSDRKQKISDVNVLLPVCSNKPCGSVSYKITAFAGCYEWSIDKPSSLVLFQIPDLESDSSCFSSVIISTITDDISTKDSLWLIAKDKKSNEEFKCKVGFASVKTLTIGKRFDHMNVGEIVELTAIVKKINIRDMMNSIICSHLWRVSNLIGK